jgi:hypothetical protein
VIVLQHAIAELACWRLALEVRMRERRVVRKGERDVEKERFITAGVSRNVVDRVVGHHPIDLPPGGLVVQLDVMRRLTFLRFADVVHILERHPGIPGPVNDVGRLEAEPLLKALIGRQASLS